MITYPSQRHQKSKRVSKQSVETLTIKRTEKPNNQFSPSYANKKHRKELETKEAKCPKLTTSKMALKIPHINNNKYWLRCSTWWLGDAESHHIKALVSGQTLISCIPDICENCYESINIHLLIILHCYLNGLIKVCWSLTSSWSPSSPTTPWWQRIKPRPLTSRISKRVPTKPWSKRLHPFRAKEYSWEEPVSCRASVSQVVWKRT